LQAKHHLYFGFELMFDLAKEWYEWQKLPFVFAVWAMKKNLSDEKKETLKEILQRSIESGEDNLETIGLLHGKSIGLTNEEIVEYLQGFNYHLGEREKEAMKVFKFLMEREREKVVE
jgi:chorismate dehydratase